jgi:predicted RNase H-like HicB family nuclease
MILFEREGNMKLKVVLEPSDEGGFTVYVPSLPGCVSEGENEKEALQNIREAVELYLEPVDDDLAGTGKEVREIVL